MIYLWKNWQIIIENKFIFRRSIDNSRNKKRGQNDLLMKER